MSATAVSNHDGNRSYGNIHIYIDNSNLWIQGQKTYAEKKGLKVSWDPTWRFDVGRLKDILTRNSDLGADEKTYDIKVKLYGSTPPPVDTVWRAIESHNVTVSTFARSSWTGREKEVDVEIVADSVDEATGAFYKGIPSTFIIVSGDRDLLSAIRKIRNKYGFPVHVWSWKNCLASIYKEQEGKELIQVQLLDDYLQQIGFHETTFRLDRSIINPHSIVVLDPLSKADAIDQFISTLKTPVYRYVCAQIRPEASSQDLVIVPAFARRMVYSELESLFNECKVKLETQGLSVLSYLEYTQRCVGDSKPELAISERFKELPEGEARVISEKREGDDDDVTGYEVSNADVEGFVTVNRRSEQQLRHLKKAGESARMRCKWRKYCSHALNCKFGHTKEEEEYFKAYGPQSAKKIKLCHYRDCIKGRLCPYAHGEQELFCPTCDKTGAGHQMDDCPENDRNKQQQFRM